MCMRATPHFFTGRLPQVMDQLPSVLGHTKQHVRFVRRASCGLPWLYACLDSPDAVINAQMSSSHLKQYCDELKTQITPEEGRDMRENGLVSFAVIKNSEEGLEIKARVFYDEHGVLVEDSATGSAALG
jgi:predicted PhzF superfamily epimerase YddE/YHI9